MRALCETMAKRSNRDEFSPSVKRLLAERVGHRCSNPDCDVPTTGAALDGGVSMIGTAAHIAAAAPGGPRFDPDMSPAQRAHADNGIWLCANHGREVDSDHERFTVQQLREWKRLAEEQSSLRLGRTQPTQRSIVEQISMAAQGMGKRFIFGAIPNVHHAISDALKSEDPRFDIATSFDGRSTHLHISANQAVRLDFAIQSEMNGPELGSKFRRLREGGVPLHLERAQVVVKGSPLFDTLLTGHELRKFELAPTPRLGAFKLVLISPDGLSRETLAPAPARIFLGTKSARCEGSAFQGLLQFKTDLSLEVVGRAQLTIEANTRCWEGVDVQALQHFDDVFDFFLKCARGWHLSVELTCEGLPVCKSVVQDLQQEVFIRGTAWHLQYTKSVRAIRSFLGTPVPARFDLPIKLDEAAAVNELGSLLGANGKTVPGFRACVTMRRGSLDLNADGRATVPHIFLDKPPLKVNVFDTSITVPRTGFLIAHVFAQGSADEGDLQDVIFTATSASTLKVVAGDYFGEEHDEADSKAESGTYLMIPGGDQ